MIEGDVGERVSTTLVEPAGKGKTKEAVPLAERAQVLGAKAEQFFLADEVKKSIAEWKAKKK